LHFRDKIETFPLYPKEGELFARPHQGDFRLEDSLSDEHISRLTFNKIVLSSLQGREISGKGRRLGCLKLPILQDLQ